MSRCSFCGYENPDGRAMHLHMLRMHPEEYQAAGRDLEEVADGYIREQKQQRKLDRKRQEEEMTQKKAAPEEQTHIRPLNRRDPDEAAAYNDGFRYYDPETDVLYTAEEAKEEGLI